MNRSRITPSQLSPTRLSPIGLDIGTGEIRAVQLASGQGGSVSMVCSAVFPRPSGPRPLAELDGAEMAAVGAVLGRRGFVGRRVVLAAPHEACTAHTLDLPAKDSGAPVQEIARAEIARKSRTAPGGFELATWYLPARGRAERGMAVACESGVLGDHLHTFDQAGFVPVAVDLQEAALARACSASLAQEPDAVHAMIQIGWATTLAVLTLGDTVVYTRRFDVGVGPAITRLKESAGLSWTDAARVLDPAKPHPSNHDSANPDVFEQASRAIWSDLGARLGDETDTAVTYVTHAHRTAPVGRVLVGGYGADRPEIIDTMDEALGMPVAPAAGWAGSETLDPATAARLAVAAGLAARFDA